MVLTIFATIARTELQFNRWNQTELSFVFAATSLQKRSFVASSECSAEQQEKGEKCCRCNKPTQNLPLDLPRYIRGSSKPGD